jgi:hypothetical protein
MSVARLEGPPSHRRQAAGSDDKPKYPGQPLSFLTSLPQSLLPSTMLTQRPFLFDGPAHEAFRSQLKMSLRLALKSEPRRPVAE